MTKKEQEAIDLALQAFDKAVEATLIELVKELSDRYSLDFNYLMRYTHNRAAAKIRVN